MKDKQKKAIVVGLFIIAPVAITAYVIYLIVMKIITIIKFVGTMIFSPSSLDKDPLMVLSIGITIVVIVWIVGFISTRKLLKGKVDPFVDSWMMKIKGVRWIYKIVNEFFKLEDSSTTKGEPIWYPYYDKNILILCYVLSTEPILACHPEHGWVHCYKVNPSHGVGTLMGGHFGAILEDVAKSIFKMQKEGPAAMLTSDEAYQANISAGVTFPERFIVKETEVIKIEEK